MILQDHFQQETLCRSSSSATSSRCYTVTLVRGSPITRACSTNSWSKYPYTLELAAGAILIAVAIGIPAGAVAALRRNNCPDLVAMIAALLAVCMPNFWLGVLVLLVFSVGLGWTPVTGAGDPTNVQSLLSHLILPAFALGSRMAALLARITRAALLDVIQNDHCRTARAKGLSDWTVFSRHVFRNSLIPVLTVMGVEIGYVLGGSAVIEIVFSRPGVGKLLVDALMARDYPLIQGALLLLTLVILLINLVVDVIYSAIDPRVRLR